MTGEARYNNIAIRFYIHRLLEYHQRTFACRVLLSVLVFDSRFLEVFGAGPNMLEDNLAEEWDVKTHGFTRRKQRSCDTKSPGRTPSRSTLCLGGGV